MSSDVKGLFVLALLLLAVWAPPAAAQWPWALPLAPRQQPHPAVVRVNVEEPDGMAHGSGTLVDVRDRFGIVITNWHVVREATGAVSVVFPDGFRSTARVLRADRDWDLAALLIWRPSAVPVAIAPQAPRPGELLTIAGYGSGDYRAQSGACTQYVAPSKQHPFEMVEVAVSARQGDSGGPILNTHGELAGVLFGSGGGATSGSYGGRVQQFLQGIWPPELELSAGTAPARNGSPPRQTPAMTASAPGQSSRLQPLPEVAAAPHTSRSASASELASAQRLSALPPPPGSPMAGPSAHAKAAATFQSTDQLAPEAAANAQPATFDWQALIGHSLPEQGKTFLAILGLFTLVAQFSRLVARRDA